MPGFTTHYIFGLSTWKNCANITIKKELKKNHSAFALGLQGPDLFFYYLPGYPRFLGNIGSVFHTKDTGMFLTALLEMCDQFKDPAQKSIAQAYTAGFFGHYILDTNCHPYIYDKSHFSIQNKTATYFGRHVYLETDIDTELLKLYKEKRPSQFYQHQTISLTNLERKTIAHLLYQASRLTYPEISLHYADLYIATLTMPFGTKVLHDSGNGRTHCGWKKTLLRKAESHLLGYPFVSPLIPSDYLLFTTDPLNRTHQIWKNPWAPTQKSNASFLQLFHASHLDYAQILEKLFYLFALTDETEKQIYLKKLCALTGNRSYHSGLDCSIPS